jgi:hypothetical protein
MIRAIRHPARVLKIAAPIALVICAAAVAYWSAAGTGTAQTTLDNPQAVTLSAGTPGVQLAPNVAASVATVASNPNPYAVQINSISLDTAEGTNGFGVDAGHAGCDLSTLSFATPKNGGQGWTVPPKVGSTPGSLPIDMEQILTMSASASDACQGASFTVYLVAGI